MTRTHAVVPDEGLDAVLGYITGDEELAELRDRYPMFAITRTRRGWYATPIWLPSAERSQARSGPELAEKIEQRLNEARTVPERRSPKPAPAPPTLGTSRAEAPPDLASAPVVSGLEELALSK